ncbi:type II toxin-antitoxin system RelE/ParE family toxin [Tardiphaga sp. 172_B4_N1_3]|uniref:type II toxin-antitoxin system RelE/ParE family toxin n=1 Tax=Tardiphaga sp. 172_B4_N1_3 TaxID=3240787 RepID=UPI003F8C38D8
MKVRLSGAARTYLLHEANYLTERSPVAGAAFLRDIRSAQQRIGNYPEIGFKPFLVRESRRLVVGDYLIDYEPGPEGIEITSIRHSRQSDVALNLDDDFDYEVDDDETNDPKP